MRETEGFIREFKTVDILVDSDTKTGRTDAFIISFTKMEKQVRRIFTYLIYQFSVFDLSHYKQILEVIASKNRLYFRNFIQGFNAIYPKTFESIIGVQECAQFMNTDFLRIKDYRNKILHGQPTGKGLSAEDLKGEITIMRLWCSRVADTMIEEIGFDGMEWNSFRKSESVNMVDTFKVKIADIQDLEDFIDSNMI